MKSKDEIIDVLCNEVGAAVYAGEYDASLIGREFVHFKGGRYRLLGFARSSESEELMVVYQTLYGEAGMWVRPAKMFFEIITRDGITEGAYLARSQTAPLDDLGYVDIYWRFWRSSVCFGLCLV